MEEVHFTLTRDDFWRLQLHAFSRTRRTRLRIVLVCVIVILVITYTIFGAIILLLLILYALLFFVALFGLLFLVMWLGASLAGKLMAKRGMHVLTISTQGVQQSNELGDSRKFWRAFKEIQEDKHNIYFRLETPDSVFMAHLIPKRAFESPQQAERFVERARAYWREQSGQTTAQS